MLNLQRIKTKCTLVAIILLLNIATVSVASESDRHEGCFKKSTPMTREEVKCRVMFSLERSHSSDIRYFLEYESDLVPGQISEAVDRLTEDWAECQVSAMIAFAATRQDIPLSLLLASLAVEISEDDRLWLQSRLKVGELWDVIKHCEEDFRDELIAYKSEP